MKPGFFLLSPLISCLSVTATRAAVYPYAEYHLGEPGSLLGSFLLPQDSSGYDRGIVRADNGSQAAVGSSTSPAAIGSTASLDTRAAGDQGWGGDFRKAPSYSSLQKNNFAFGIFVLAPAAPASGICNIFSLGAGENSLGIAMHSEGWGVRAFPYLALKADSGSFVPNTWTHLAVIRTNNTIRFYVNGIEQSGSSTVEPGYSDEPILAGYRPDYVGHDFNGLLDEARVVTFSQGETPARIIAALQAGVLPTAFVRVGGEAVCRKASLSPTEPSVFRIGGAVQDFVKVLDPGGLEIGGTGPQKHVIQIAKEAPVAAGRYPLIGFAGSIGGQSFAGLELAPVASRFAASLEINAANSTIDLVLSGSDGLTWTGSGSEVWNIQGAANWVLDGTSTTTQFLNADDVTFDDSAAVTARAVTIAETVSPGFVTVNSSGDYTFRGAGIGGGAILTKKGSGTLTLANPNTATGAISINAGTVSVGDGGTAGSLGSGPVVLKGGQLVVNRTGGDLLLPNRFSGPGAFQKFGAGRLILGTPGLTASQASYNDPFTGPVTISEGEVVSASESCFGSRSGSTTIAAGASFEIAGIGAGLEPFFINGNGVNNEGAIKNNGAAISPAISGTVTLASDSSLGGSGDWKLQNILTGDFKMTKVGSNQIEFSSIQVKDIDLNSGTILLKEGSLIDNTLPGQMVIDGGTLWFEVPEGGGLPRCRKPVVLKSGSIRCSGSLEPNQAGWLEGSLQLYSNAPITCEAYSRLIVTGEVTGNGELVKEGGGTLGIAQPNYPGNTTIRSGTLQVSTPGYLLTSSGLSDTSTVNVASRASLALYFFGTDRVNKLILGGVEQPAGYYSYKTHPSYLPFRGNATGALFVANGLTGTPYEIWEKMNGVAGEGPAADSDHDGISNAIEFVIGGDLSGPDSNSRALLPAFALYGLGGTSASLDFTYRRSFLSKDSVKVEYGSNLSDDWTVAQDRVAGVDIFEENNYFGPGIDRVTVRIPQAAKPRLMARLLVDLP